MRTLAIGDIHGCNTALTSLLRGVSFRPDDQIIFLGDYIDRGPASRSVLETLLELNTTRPAVFLRGNHEVMILEARDDLLKANLWQSYGGSDALISYGAEYSQNWAAAIPDAHWEFIERTARFFETDSSIFVHACADPDLDMDEQLDWLLFWEFFDRLQPHKSGKRIVCGHSPQRSGHIKDMGFAACIDTGVASGGWLTCLDVASGEFWQANERGELRSGSLEK